MDFIILVNIGGVLMLTLKNMSEILNSLPDPTFILTKAGRYVEIFGGKDLRYYHDASKLVGLSVTDVLNTEKSDWFLGKIKEALKTNKLLITEYNLSRKDVKGLDDDGPSNIIYFEGRIQPLNFSVEGEPAVLWQATNITQRYQLEEKLRTISETDPLTGIWNRRYFYQMIEKQKGVANRSLLPMSLLMLDIDHFKVINDQWGHKIGDLVLSEVVKVMLDCIRESDLIIRWGGEEFLIFMVKSGLAAAACVAEKLRLRIESYSFINDIKVRVSIGYVQWDTVNKNIEETIANADTALYLAKSEGRNCIKAYSG
ncbi:sensor domain-containing diguanylate cyclase [Colwellia sp. E2M01]|uniref:sensor domain-containing diguanylate cyclase n=1 Tax=Colwellia sp. E2M01 TaxID=2841561 RepID=UPI001C09FFD5|nr:sensor domain-containing diguanylate cyclase [Colwellia sp. E2M01]MBU2869763.1 sensor domain-containing diguanylate cyclase [Colwellia sp. E2M01]